jgi:hypothetical protein
MDDLFEIGISHNIKIGHQPPLKVGSAYSLNDMPTFRTQFPFPFQQSAQRLTHFILSYLTNGDGMFVRSTEQKRIPKNQFQSRGKC